MPDSVHNAFFRKREIWLPTWRTLLLLMIIVVAGLAFAGKKLAWFLAVHQPVAANYLVVEGWLDKSELQQAVTEFETGKYHAIITTGGPIYKEVNPVYSSYAERAAKALQQLGIAADRIIIVPAPASAQERTFLSAVMVRNYLIKMTKTLPDALNLFTSGVHARRTFYLYQQAFRQTPVKLGIIAAKPGEYSLDRWWQTSAGAKTVLTEFIGWLWVRCFFRPDQVGSHAELWGEGVGQMQKINSGTKVTG